jgi:hypothetical protein
MFKNTFKTSNEINIVKPIAQLNNKYTAIKKVLIFSFFFKKAMTKLKLKSSKVYKKNVLNLMKYSKLSI